jgi:hypothetical protein
VGYGLAESLRYTVAPPGRIPLRNIRFSLVDVPDLRLLPDLWPGLRSIWMGAGPVPEMLHRVLNVCAFAVRLKLVPSLSPLAGLMYRAINVLRWANIVAACSLRSRARTKRARASSARGTCWPKATTAR